ncbi:hypothetical protein [Bifidobacterium psychraerophilum]|nr:hypothetical protein [Bifidobacterium psychraerophilum]
MKDYSGLLTSFLNLFIALLSVGTALRLALKGHVSKSLGARACEAVKELGDLDKVDAALFQGKKRIVVDRERSRLEDEIAQGFAYRQFKIYFRKHISEANKELRVQQRSLDFMWWLVVGFFVPIPFMSIFPLLADISQGPGNFPETGGIKVLFLLAGSSFLLVFSSTFVNLLWQEKVIRLGFDKFIAAQVNLSNPERTGSVLYDRKAFEQLERYCIDHKRHAWVYRIPGLLTGTSFVVAVILVAFAKAGGGRFSTIMGVGLVLYLFFLLLILVEMIVYFVWQFFGNDPYRFSKKQFEDIKVR